MDGKSKIIFHIDMNAFFASCEQAINPDLRDKPIIVGGDPERRSGIVLAASYEAKNCGVKTASTLYSALKLCPQAIVIKSSHGLYEKMSKKVMAIFDEYTPLKEQLSIDEAFLDMTGTEHLFGEPIECALKIQKHILDELCLPSSVGISNNKLLAKMASDLKKPMGITTLYPNEVSLKLWPLPVGELYGVGRKSVPKLNKLGIVSIGDLAQANISILEAHFGPKGAKMMKESANGLSSNQLLPEEKETVKSVGNELTYSEDITEIERVKKEILILSDKVAYRLRKKMLKGKTITLKIKYNDFSVITRSKTIKNLTDSTDKIYEVAKELAIKNAGTKPIRLIGVTVSNFDNNDIVQISLFNDDKIETKKVDKMVDIIRKKYGYDAIKKVGEMKNYDKKN